MDWPHYLASPVVGFIVYVIVYVIFVYFVVFWPVIRILRRIGRSAWWSLLIFCWPLGLWLLAYTRWPATDPPKD
jgi:hypothetical protein